MNITLTIVAIAASVLGSGMALPQALRLFRTGRTDGVSPTWIGVSLAINAWWTAYAIAVSLWALLPVATVSIVLYAGIAVAYSRASETSGVPGILAGAFLLGMVPLPVLIAGGWELAGLAVGLCYGLQLAPAVVTAYRTRELLGVSTGTWVISFVEAALWLGYGFGVGDFALVAGGVSGIVMSAAILVRLVAIGRLPRVSGVAQPAIA